MWCTLVGGWDYYSQQELQKSHCTGSSTHVLSPENARLMHMHEVRPQVEIYYLFMAYNPKT